MGRERLTQVLLLALTLGACDRAPANEPATAPPTAPSNAPTKVVVPTEGAPIVAPPSSEPTDTGPGTVGSTVPSTIGGPAVATGAPAVATTPPSSGTTPPAGGTTPPSETERTVPSRRGIRVPAASPNAGAPAMPVAPTAPATTPPSVPPPSVPPPQMPTPTLPPATLFATKVIVSEKLFRIELAPPAPCKAATACEAKLVVHSLDGYKVNAEYPTKFVAKASPGVTVDGTGAFAVTSRNVGTMTVTFRAAQAGTARLSGAFKLSVCTDEICEIAAPAIAFDIPVAAP